MKGAAKSPVLVVGRVAGVFGIGFPHALAVVGFPADGTAGGGKVLSSDPSGLLGFSVADFVKVHCFVLLSFCTLIIAHKGAFVNPPF